MTTTTAPATTIIDPQAKPEVAAPKITGFKSPETKAELAGTRIKMALMVILDNYVKGLRGGEREEILASLNLVTNSPFADSDEKTSLSLSWSKAKGSGERDPAKLEKLLRKKKVYRGVAHSIRIVDEVLLNKAVADGKLTLADLASCNLPLGAANAVLKVGFSDPTDGRTVINNFDALISMMLDPKNADKALQVIATAAQIVAG